jgi:hypothetical protein
MGRFSRDKGNRVERNLVKTFQRYGIPAIKVSRAYQPGEDLVLWPDDWKITVEVKCRARGWPQIQRWLGEGDLLVLAADRQEPMVVMSLDSYCQLVYRGDHVD